MYVTLEPHEIEIATAIGIQRNLRANNRDSVPRFAYSSAAESDNFHVKGALAECAAAKALGLYWNMGVDTFLRVPDLGCVADGTDVEVRWSAHETLKVKENDPDDTRVLSVSGGPKEFMLRGWCFARAGKRREWLKAPRVGVPAFFVPLNFTYPIAELEAVLMEARKCSH